MPEAQDSKNAKPVKVYCKLPHGIRYTLPDGREVRLVGMYGDERSDLQVTDMPGRHAVMGHGVTTVEADDWEQIVRITANRPRTSTVSSSLRRMTSPARHRRARAKTRRPDSKAMTRMHTRKTSRRTGP